MAALLTGFVGGAGRLVAELYKASLSGWLHYFADINFLHFALFLFLICSGVLILVSLVTAPPPAERLMGLTVSTPERGEVTAAGGRRVRNDLLLSGVLLLVVLLVWGVFPGLRNSLQGAVINLAELHPPAMLAISPSSARQVGVPDGEPFRVRVKSIRQGEMTGSFRF